ncbi:STAS domain-containing protein [Streptosporangium sp. KLBMP 9127]|nr:STAS domain-containing protein [Streptosporangium sp. KLBMP 9127]
MDLSTHSYPDWTVCRVTGDVDIFTGNAFREQLLAVVDRPGCRILIDLSGVTFMDANGLGILVFARRAAISGGGTLRLLAPTVAMRRLLTASGLAGLFTVSLDLADARRAEPFHTDEPPPRSSRHRLTQV